MYIWEKLHNHISGALKELGISETSFVLEHPVELAHGDYATNVALVVSKQLGKNPHETAETIVAEIQKQSIPEIENITIAGPGFINFTLSQKSIQELTQQVIEQGDMFGNNQERSGQQILIEHSSPNLFKPFHIGHMMNNAIGESLVRLFRASGATVTTMSFPSDISIGIAKAIFVILEKAPDGNLEKPSIEILGNAYSEGTKRYDEDETIHARVKEIADNLYSRKTSPELTTFENCKQFNIAYFETIIAKLGSQFDSYIYESQAGEIGKKIVLENTPTVFTESQGAIVYIPDESKKHLNTAVFINSQGNPTYGAKDVGLLDLKFQKQKWDQSLFVTDHEQIPHFNIVLDVAEKINPTWSENSKHVPHGRMSFQGEKMSSRLGNTPLITEMLDLVGEEVSERSQGRDIDDVTKESIAIGAIKFSILRAKPGQNINFDPETSLSFEGDSGPYLQYTHARIVTLLKKAQSEGLTPKLGTGSISEPERLLYRFPEITTLATRELAPNYIVTYLLEIARSFNSFYGANKIIDTENKSVSAHRLAIARAVQIVLKNGLALLAIHAPEKM